jgi:hypothetical protein
MHHLEPLFWDAHAPSVPLIACGHDILVHVDQLPSSNPAQAGLRFIRSSLSIRSIFRQIEVFRRGAEHSVLPTRQAATAHAALELARVEFAMGQWQPWSSAGFRAESDRCVAELEALVSDLSRGKDLPPFELAHAFDALIALLVQIDGASGAGAARPSRPADADFAADGALPKVTATALAAISAGAQHLNRRQA